MAVSLLRMSTDKPYLQRLMFAQLHIGGHAIDSVKVQSFGSSRPRDDSTVGYANI